MTISAAKFLLGLDVPGGAGGGASTGGGPTGPVDPPFANVALLLHFDGTNGQTTTTDSSSKSTPVTINGTSLSTAQFKFGTASFSSEPAGNNGYLSFPNTNITLGTADFTVEMWYYYTADNDATGSLFVNYDAGEVSPGLQLRFGGANILRLQLAGSIVQAAVSNAFTLNAWNHIAAVRSGTTVTLYVGGIQVAQGTTSASAAPSSTSVAHIGSDGNGLAFTRGYFDDVRITPGVAIYSAAFTPPIAAFPNS